MVQDVRPELDDRLQVERVDIIIHGSRAKVRKLLRWTKSGNIEKHALRLDGTWVPVAEGAEYPPEGFFVIEMFTEDGFRIPVYELESLLSETTQEGISEARKAAEEFEREMMGGTS